MPWLEPTPTLKRAGYPMPDTFEGSDAERAIDYAETLIEARTGVTWGSSQNETHRIRLSTKSFWLPLPNGVTSATITKPTDLTEVDTIITTAGLERIDGELFEAGLYEVGLERGHTEIPEDVLKAGSLLVAHYLDLSDPDRSRVTELRQGDFMGTMRFTELPVPEAEILLRKYVSSVSGALT